MVRPRRVSISIEAVNSFFMGESKNGGQPRPVLRCERADGSLYVFESSGGTPASGSENNDQMLLRVTVPYDEASLKHPVKKWLEVARVLYRLVCVGSHLMVGVPRPNDPSSATDAGKERGS